MLQAGSLVTTGNVPAYPSFVTLAQFHDRLRGWKPGSRANGSTGGTPRSSRVPTARRSKRYVDEPIGQSFDVRLLSRTEHPDDFDLQFDGYRSRIST